MTGTPDLTKPAEEEGFNPPVIPLFGELRDRPRPAPLIKGLLNKSSLTMLTGAPGSYKSLMAMSWAFSIAMPGIKHWEGYAVKEHGDVLYLAAEGGEWLWEFAVAWAVHKGVDVNDLNGRFWAYDEQVNIGDWRWKAWILQQVEQMRPKLIVLDTKERASSGLDENSVADQGNVIDFLEEVRKKTGACILPVHHTSKSGAGPRGSSVWDGAVHYDLRLSRDEIGDEYSGKTKAKTVTLLCHKRKGEEDQCQHRFRADFVTLPEELRRPDGEPGEERSIVLVNDEEAEFFSIVGADKAREKVLSILDECGQLNKSALMKFMTEDHSISERQAYASIQALVREAKVIEENNRNSKRYRKA
jgi:hypothetical protein